MELERLRGRKIVDRLRNKGNTWKSATVVVRWLPGKPRHPAATKEALYVGTLASTKLDKSAVARNRMRRRVREALRISLKEEANLPSAQLLLSPRSSSLDCAFENILRDIRAFLLFLRRCPPPPSNPASSSSS